MKNFRLALIGPLAAFALFTYPALAQEEGEENILDEVMDIVQGEDEGDGPKEKSNNASENAEFGQETAAAAHERNAERKAGKSGDDDDDNVLEELLGDDDDDDSDDNPGKGKGKGKDKDKDKGKGKKKK